MKIWPWKHKTLRPELPLLQRELIEQAARTRTYVIRFLYALILFVVFGGFLFSIVTTGGGQIALASLGTGKKVFDVVVTAQLIGIFIILPAMVADVITRERERNSLDLLLLTQLRPWDIILQKLLSRVVPMLTILMLCMPLLAVAYAYGGVTAEEVGSTAYALVILCMLVGAMCVKFSIDAPKTSTAMLGCYIRVPMAFIMLAIVMSLVGYTLLLFFMRMIFGVSDMSWFYAAMLLPIFFVDPTPPLWVTVTMSIPAVICILWYMRAAQNLLEQMMLANPGSPPKPSFEIATVEQHRRARTRGETLPDDKPIAWFELNSRLMTQLNKVYWMLVLADLPIFIYLASAIFNPRNFSSQQLPGFTWLTVAAWWVGLMVLGLTAASAFAAERGGRTLDVLLVTPIHTQRILWEKLAAARKCIWMVCLPLAAIFISEWLLEATHRGEKIQFTSLETWVYPAAAFSTLCIYVWLAVWIGLWIGMRVRDRGRASLAFLGVMLLWTLLVPLLVTIAQDLMTRGGASGTHALFSLAYLLSPASVVMANANGTWDQMFTGSPWIILLLNSGFYLGLTMMFRRMCLARATEYLGRVPDPPLVAQEAVA